MRVTDAKHTPGRLKIDEHTCWIVTEGDPYGHGSMHVADVRGWGHLTGVGACNLDEETAYAIQQANAQRIVATWNACEGIPTEALEAGVVREMVEVLKETQTAMNWADCDGRLTSALHSCGQRIDAVLAKLRGEQP